MSRATELSTVYRELTAAEMQMVLVGTYEAAREIERAMEIIYHQYRIEVERAAQTAAEAV